MSKRIDSRRTFRVPGALAVAVAFVIFALLPVTAEGFTLIDVFNQFGCLTAAAKAWDDCLTNFDLCKMNGFSGGIGLGGPFFSLSVGADANYLYTYGDEATNTHASIRIRPSEFSKLPQWRTHAMETDQTLYIDVENTWKLMGPPGLMGNFHGNLHFAFGHAGLLCVVPEYER